MRFQSIWKHLKLKSLFFYSLLVRSKRSTIPATVFSSVYAHFLPIFSSSSQTTDISFFKIRYVAHSSFTIIFPLHVLYLSSTTGTPLTAYFSTLRKALASRLTAPASDRDSFPIHRLALLILALTAGINIPALLWYAAVSLTS